MLRFGYSIRPASDAAIGGAPGAAGTDWLTTYEPSAVGRAWLTAFSPAAAPPHCRARILAAPTCLEDEEGLGHEIEMGEFSYRIITVDDVLLGIIPRHRRGDSE